MCSSYEAAARAGLMKRTEVVLEVKKDKGVFSREHDFYLYFCQKILQADFRKKLFTQKRGRKRERIRRRELELVLKLSKTTTTYSDDGVLFYNRREEEKWVKRFKKRSQTDEQVHSKQSSRGLLAR